MTNSRVLLIIRENTPHAYFSNDVGTKSSVDDLPDIEARMASTSSGVTRVMPVKVAPVCCELHINGPGAMLPSTAVTLPSILVMAGGEPRYRLPSVKLPTFYRQ